MEYILTCLISLVLAALLTLITDTISNFAHRDEEHNLTDYWM